MSYDNSCKITYMDSPRQDPIAQIEQAVIALRHSRPRGSGGPWMRGGPHAGEHPLRGRGPHDRSMGGAARFRLLAALRERDGLSVSEIAALIGVDQPRASRLVNDSAERGLVTRRADERDARRSVVELTALGRSILSTTTESRRTAVADAMAGFSDEEAATFAALLGRFVESWTRREP
jgi:DNA-binding MarR family transcriptional regulator